MITVVCVSHVGAFKATTRREQMLQGPLDIESSRKAGALRRRDGSLPLSPLVQDSNSTTSFARALVQM